MVEIEIPGTTLATGTVGRPASGAEAIAASGQDVVLTFADRSRALGHLSGNRLDVKSWTARDGAEHGGGAWRVNLRDGALVLGKQIG